MRAGVRSLIVAGMVVAVAALWFTAVRVPGQAGSDVARVEDGQPNLNGIWQAMTTANWNIEAHNAEAGPHPEIMGAWGAQPGGIGIVEGGTIPYKPEALERRQENFKNRMVVKVTNDPHRFDTGDPELQCYRPGVPRANYMPFPFQIFQNQEQILIVYEYKGAMRLIHIEPAQEAPVDSWMGWSNGRWEGDTLVVDVKGFNGYTWFDRAGNYATDALHVVERWVPKGPNHHHVRGDDRRPERLHAAVEGQLSDLSTSGAERAAHRVQLRAVRGGNDVRTAGPVRSAGAVVTLSQEACMRVDVLRISAAGAIAAVLVPVAAVLLAQAPSGATSGGQTPVRYRRGHQGGHRRREGGRRPHELDRPENAMGRSGPAWSVADGHLHAAAASARARFEGVLHRGGGDCRVQEGGRDRRRGRPECGALRLERVRDGSVAGRRQTEPAHVAHRRSSRRAAAAAQSGGPAAA